MESLGTRQPLTVADLVQSVRATLRASFGSVRVTGEISNFRRPSSGHCYFTLKDDRAQIRCVLFRGDAARLGFALQDGMQVVVAGEIDVYEARGDLQLRAITVRSAGEGALQKAFDRLKLRLQEEGLFDRERKKPIPRFPRRVGIVTSRSGAALHDMLTILQRRYPVVRVVVVPVPVQGLEAASQIADVIRELDRLPAGDIRRPDVLIVGRGGGSVEDLWSFNEEAVARAIFDCGIPVISAVGHETDFSIADFVADVRAATPSMAAEISVPDRAALLHTMTSSVQRARSSVRRVLNIDRRRLTHLVHSHGFNRPLHAVQQFSQRTDDLVERMRAMQRHRLTAEAGRVSALIRQFEVLDPRRTLERGYARVERNGVTIRLGSDLETGESVRIHFSDGHREARITD